MSTPTDRHPIIELRQYTLHPGRRDALIALFDREFVEPQEEAGMTVLGQFRDLDDADRFVWLRGFANMPARAEALAAFYDGPVWRAHREAANATMLDSDDVLLLRPVASDHTMPIDAWQRSAGGASAASTGALLAVVVALANPASSALVAALERGFAPPLAQAGGTRAACYVTESAANSFPRLPVREGESVVVWLARFDDVPGCTRCAAAVARTQTGLAQIAAEAANRLVAPIQTLRLTPTARSRF